jgi:hypothetical protein
MIKSVLNTDQEILEATLQLYIKDITFDVDPCYSKGVFYKKMLKPRFVSDINPLASDVIKADSRKLPLPNNSVKSIIFDPPFLFRDRPSKNNDKNCNRFTYFQTWNDLLQMYKDSLIEFKRILKRDGHVVFKCQDMTDDKIYMTHCEIYNMAKEIGFQPVDFFILLAKNRIYHSELKQRHARKYHSYYFIFKSLPNIGVSTSDKTTLTNITQKSSSNRGKDKV